MYRNEVGAAGRFRLRGQLTTQSPLHIGDGERERISARKGSIPDSKRADAEFATVFLDHRRVPLIPGTSLKGSLRQWASAHKENEPRVNRLFGNLDGCGRITFADGVFAEGPAPQIRFFDPDRKTCLVPQVAIDPHTRSADEGLLYFVEFVPPGTVFDLCFTGQGLSEEDLRAFVNLVEQAFADLSLGANSTNGWGRVSWRTVAIETLDAQALREWLAADSGGSWTDALREAPWRASARPAATPKKETVELRLELDFNGAVLVNDPSQTRKGEQAISHAMICDTAGAYILPATSVRGALRGTARKIWQTLAKDGADLSRLPRSASRVSQPGDQAQLAGFLRMFGATGWRSPIEMEDFRLVGDTRVHLQEFVAIDRFMGGASQHRKFKARALWRPRFAGYIRLDVDRWPQGQTWPWLLLAYVLRDWMEGDGRIGFGAAKGYGAFLARVEVVGSNPNAALLKRVLAREAAALQSKELDEWAASLDAAILGGRESA